MKAPKIFASFCVAMVLANLLFSTPALAQQNMTTHTRGKLWETLFNWGFIGHPGAWDYNQRTGIGFYPGFSGIVSVEFDMPIEKVKKMAASFQWFTLAESLGGVESLVCHPASMTHASIPAEIRAQRGLSDKLLRFSVGIEAIEDLLEDVKHQLRR